MTPPYRLPERPPPVGTLASSSADLFTVLTCRVRQCELSRQGRGGEVNSQKSIQASRYRSIQVLVALFSVIFIIVIAYGYYHLLTGFGWFVALLVGLIIAAVAWFLARVAGTGEGGMKKNWVLIIPLFLISAAGVYNSLMVYLEGQQVLSDTASDAQRRFGMLETAANGQLESQGIARRINHVNSLRDALFSEIQNPLNCGQGPEARRVIAELQRELPEFKPLSSPVANCTQNEPVINDYKARIGTLVAGAPWNDATLNDVAAKAAQARTNLADLRSEITRSYTPESIRQIASIFEEQQTSYQDLLFRLGKKTDISSLPQELDVVSAQSLGNIYKLPALFFSRMDQASTFAYLLVALGFDLLLVYLFQLVAKNRVRRPAIAGAIAGAW